MAELVITQNITVDGVVEMAGDWFAAQDDDPGAADVLAATREQMARETAFLVGRRTFEDMRGFWPAQSDDTTGITEHLNTVDKFVFSRTLTDPGWAGSTVLRGEVAEEVARLKRDREGVIGVTGSIDLCHQLIAADLVDEYRLFVHPRVLGRGRRLFPDGTDLPLRLVDSRPFANGIVLTTHRPA